MQITLDQNLLALYGAIAGTLGLFLHALSYIRGSKSIIISHQFNMEVVGDPTRQGPCFIVNVVNAGPINVTITGVGFRHRAPKKFALLPDTNPRMPARLSQGEQLHAFGDETKASAKDVVYFYASDSTGHHRYSPVAPLPTYWFYRLRDAMRC